jgi:hypothetical protein
MMMIIDKLLCYQCYNVNVMLGFRWLNHLNQPRSAIYKRTLLSTFLESTISWLFMIHFLNIMLPLKSNNKMIYTCILYTKM